MCPAVDRVGADGHPSPDRVLLPPRD